MYVLFLIAYICLHSVVHLL